MQPLCFYDRLIQNRDHTQNLFIIFIISQCLLVCFEEWHITVSCKFPAKLIQIDCLIVGVLFAEFKFLSRHKFYNAIFFIQFHDRTIHPAFILIHQCQRISWIIDQRTQNGFLKNNIRFQKQSIFF